MERRRRFSDAEREALLDRLRDELVGWKGLAFACVFGSFLEPRDAADIDVGVWLDEGAGRDADLELASVLTRLAAFPVDVRRLNDAPPSFLFHALRGRMLAVRNEGRLADLMERTARTYHDMAPRLRQATREAFAS